MIRSDAQPYDEIRVTTIPRYKESELSGDEWRISAQISFYRKGEVVHVATYRDVETAAGFMYAEFHKGCDGGQNRGSERDRCDQEGCSRQATVFYKMKARYSRDGHKTDAAEYDKRQFCFLHKTRGDCGLDDADANYEIIQ